MKERRREMILVSGSSVIGCIELKLSPPECDLRRKEGKVLSDFLLDDLEFDGVLCTCVAWLLLPFVGFLMKGRRFADSLSERGLLLTASTNSVTDEFAFSF